MPRQHAAACDVERLENRTLLTANISAGIQFSSDGSTFSDDLLATGGNEVFVRVNYDNTGDMAATNAQVSVTLPAGLALVPNSTRTGLTPDAGEEATNMDAGQSGAIDESAVWSGSTLTISPQAGLYAQAVDATSGMLEMGKLRYINLHDCHYFNGAERFYTTADPDISGTNVSNTLDAAAACAGTVGAYGNAGQELRSAPLLGNRYLNYHECHYNFFTDHIYKDADGTATRTSNTVDAAFNCAGTAGAHILHPDSNVANLDLLGNRYLNLHEGRYISGGDLISLNIAAGGTNTSNTPDAGPSFPATFNAYTLNDSDHLALDMLDTARGAGYVEFKVDISALIGSAELTAMLNDLSGGGEFANLSDSGTISTPTPDMFVVTTEVDENDGSPDPGTGAGTSLREAVIAANAGTNQSTITFDPSLDGIPILLTIAGADEDAAATGDLDITTPVTITGNGAANTIIDAGGVSGLGDRVFDVRSDGTADFESLTVRGGSLAFQGAGIRFDNADGTVTDSVIENNDGIGLLNSVGDGNSLLVTGSTIAGNTGGGLSHFVVDGTSSLDVVESTISGNSAPAAGGVSNFGVGTATANLVIRDSTISDNMATNPSRGGGGIRNEAAHQGTANLYVINSTLSGNMTAGVGSAIENVVSYSYIPGTGPSSGLAANAMVTNSTIAGNTGGVASIRSDADAGQGQTAAVTINNTIVTGSTAADLSTFGGGNTVTGSNNLSDDATLPGTIAAVSNLDTNLADNGGPTPTHGLYAGSNALDAGSNPLAVDETSTALVNDQRGAGFDRILNSTVDIGAVEGTIPIPLDFGDAPDASVGGTPSGYPTTLADDGARHAVTGPTLGPERDAEPDGLPSAAADGDDTDASPDDEDGITFAGPIVFSFNRDVPGSVDVDLQNPDGSSNLLNAWIDFNRDGDWDDSGEQVLTDFDLGTSAGVQTVTFTVPQGASAGDTFARFRLSTAGGLAPTGAATDGEVEDHPVSLESSLGGVVGRDPSTGNWWLGRSNGSALTNHLWGHWQAMETWLDATIGDFNGDGNDDIAGRRQSDGQIWVALSDGMGGSTNQLWGQWDDGVPWTDVGAADVNGDGYDDLIGRQPNNGNWWVGLSDGAGNFANQNWGHWAPSSTWVDVHVADVNGDGNDDLVGRELANGQWWASVSDGVSGFANQLWGLWSAGVTWLDVNIADVNGDGNDDIVGRQQSNGNWWAAISDGVSSFTNQNWGHWSPAVTWINVNIADVNGDGNDDIVGREQANGQWWTAISDGAGSFTNQLWGLWSVGATWVDVQVADVDGDGNDDILGREQGNGKWWVARSNGTNAFTNEMWGQWDPTIAWTDVGILEDLLS